MTSQYYDFKIITTGTIIEKKLSDLNHEIAYQTKNMANELHRQNELTKLKMLFDCGKIGISTLVKGVTEI